MKALTLWQPWASLVAIGAKRIETRSWQPNYVGPLAIHAAQTRDHAHRAIGNAFMRSAFLEADIELEFGKDGLGLPYGAVVAVCRLSACIQITRNNRPKLPELDFGDFTPGRFAWHLTNVYRLPDPIPARGYQGLWDWDQPDWIMKEIA